MNQVLDQGYIKVVESWGSDERIIEAARMSTGKGFRGWDKDLKLLKYLYTHKHMTPFEMCGFTIEAYAPIFVIREWFRHRTQSYNEESARYKELEDNNYYPEIHDVVERANKDTKNKQEEGGDHKTTRQDVELWIRELDKAYKACQDAYELGLKFGIPRELARLSVPVARYSHFRASGNLRNWLGFMTLRCDSNAQKEIREYANSIKMIVRDRFPRTYRLWREENEK